MNQKPAVIRNFKLSMREVNRGAIPGQFLGFNQPVRGIKE
jgi:hypothetical protein